MNVFNEQSQSYFDKGLSVCPLKGKNPAIGGSNWQIKNFEGKSFPNCNIGLKTGKPSGVICVDIDTTDEKLKKEIYSMLPPLYSGKTGNKEKGNNYFFAYNGEEGRKFGGVVEILSTGNQTVLPPSIHPDKKYPYEWIGKPLLEVDELPDLPKEFISWCDKKFRNEHSFTEGRNNKLYQICSAGIGRGDDPTTVINELISYDKENHSPPWFEDESEVGNGSDPYMNAMKFYFTTAKNLHRKGGFEKPQVLKIETIEKIEPKKRERKKYPHLRGVMQEMFQYVYDNSPVSRSRFALASALSATSVILGNKIRCDDIYPNLYSLMIAPSGSGKDFPLKFPKKLLMKSGHMELIGQSHPASDTGLIMTLPEQSVRIDTIDEADILFGAINNNQNSYASKMADVYATLYTSCGEYFEGKVLASFKEKRVGACHAPYVTLLSAMTPNAFRDSFTVKTIEKGLGGRFMYFIDEAQKKSKPMTGANIIPQNLIRFTKMWRDLPNTNGFQMENGQNIINVRNAEMTKWARKELEDAHAFIEEQKIASKSDDKLIPILNRGYVTIVKLALLDAVSTQAFSTDIKIEKDSILWAMKFYAIHLKDMKEFIDVNVSGSLNERMTNLVLEKIQSAKTKGINSTELFRKTRSLNKKQRDAILKELIENEEIVAAKEAGDFKKPKTVFYSKNYTKRIKG